jgi:hypothetical protein
VIDWILGAVVGGIIAWMIHSSNARSREKAEEARRNLVVSKKSQEIENEIEALGSDDLKRRAVKWVRDAGK